MAFQVFDAGTALDIGFNVVFDFGVCHGVLWSSKLLKLSSGLMQLGAALCLAPFAALLLVRTGALLPLVPYGLAALALGLLVALVDVR